EGHHPEVYVRGGTPRDGPQRRRNERYSIQIPIDNRIFDLEPGYFEGAEVAPAGPVPGDGPAALGRRCGSRGAGPHRRGLDPAHEIVDEILVEQHAVGSILVADIQVGVVIDLD